MHVTPSIFMFPRSISSLTDLNEALSYMIPSTLAAGYRQFRNARFEAEEARYRALAAGQDPETMIIACADSRVDPATIFAAALCT